MKHQQIEGFQQYGEEHFTKRIIFKTSDSTVFMLNFGPGQQLPAHKHPGAEVYILVQEGSGFINCDEVETEVHAGDVIQVLGDEQMSYRSSDAERSSLYVTLVNIPEAGYAKNWG